MNIFQAAVRERIEQNKEALIMADRRSAQMRQQTSMGEQSTQYSLVLHSTNLIPAQVILESLKDESLFD